MKSLNFKAYVRCGVLGLGLVSTGACSESNFAQAAAQLCDLYSAESLAQAGADADLQTLYGHILERQSTVIKNKKLNTILKSADSSSFAAYANSITLKIESELGEPWTCAHFQQFFLPEQRVVRLQLQGIENKAINPQSDSVVTIMVAHSGEVLLNNAPLKDTAQLKPGLNAVIAGRSVDVLHFVLYFDQGSNGEWVSELLATLTEMGVRSVDLIDL